jgi:hypothetical protein
MGVVVGVLAVSVALARDGLVHRMRGVMPYVNRVSGALLVLAGTYVAYYGVYELRQAGGNLAEDPVVGAATSVQGALARFIDDLGPWILLAGLVLLLVVGLGIHGSRRRNMTKVRPTG